MPAYQGEFDGLCGMYAIANAYEECGYEDGCAELFQVSCNALAHRRWPRVLWEGTTFGGMKKMISACQDEIEIQYHESVIVGYPFWHKPPKSNKDYWKKFDDIFGNENVVCGIVGMTKPQRHWVVISRDTKRRVWFIDSDGDEPVYRKNLASLNAGERRRWESQWLLDRRELIVFATPE